MIHQISAAAPNFKGIQKYPYNYTKEQNAAYEYLRDNILRSPKYADEKGNTLEKSFERFGMDVVIYPSGSEKITYVLNHKNKPMKTIEEVNRPYPNVRRVGCTSEEEIVDIFQTSLDTCKITEKSSKKDLSWIIGGILTSFIGTAIFMLCAHSHSPKVQEKNIEKTVLHQDSINTAAKKAIEIFKN